ncbi:hypothetical protein [Nocardia carnea]|uniref:hypothetical protein n=1 Tax=Nocardia carnea TaxID=37328 RepID=UPI0024545EBC|nr:hypothetical protein [Nocardia carnea]
MGSQYFETDTRGHLPARTDIDAVLRDGDERALYAVWETYGYTRLLREMLVKLDDRDAVRADLAAVALITPAQALEANRRLVGLLTERRMEVIQQAREGGDSWTVLGAALGVTKQGALDWYNRKIAERGKRAGKFHNAEQARAPLDE